MANNIISITILDLDNRYNVIMNGINIKPFYVTLNDFKSLKRDYHESFYDTLRNRNTPSGVYYININYFIEWYHNIMLKQKMDKILYD